MIRGTTAQFKFNMPYEFDDLCIIEVTFWQPNNEGTTTAPMPIVKLYNRDIVVVDVASLPSGDDIDGSKIYRMGEKYYRWSVNEWTESDNVGDLYDNDGIKPDSVNKKVLFTFLTPEETMRFLDTRKGYVQIKAYCNVCEVTFASKPSSFCVYPVASDNIFGEIGQSHGYKNVQILDAGEIE